MKPQELKRVLIMAGGTGGHVFPGLAVAAYFQRQGVEVHWLGTATGLEAKLVPQANLPLHLIQVTGLRGKGLKTLLLAPYKLVNAVVQAAKVIKELQPNVVIGMGGFASGPGGVAAWLLGYPLVIHEQNAKPGLTNRILARISHRVLTGFPTAFLPQRKVIPVGNPVRDEIIQVSKPCKRLLSRGKPFRLLVLGGSLGAQGINHVVPAALAKLSPQERPEIMHQTGEKHYQDAVNAYQTAGLTANIQPFITDMAAAYNWADMVLCRAGALTVAELCAVGLGAIFVPYPHAADDHQTANAKYMVENKAAICVQQKELTETKLADIVRRFTDSPDERFVMAQAAFQLRKDNVAQRIFQICQEICN